MLNIIYCAQRMIGRNNIALTATTAVINTAAVRSSSLKKKKKK